MLAPERQGCNLLATMSAHQEAYDDATFAYSQGDYRAAIDGFESILKEDPAHFDAQLALAMCHYRQENYPRAIEEGHKAERMRPNDPAVHTNLSLFYQRIGDKKTAEHHGLQSRIASWRDNMNAPAPTSPGEGDLRMAAPPAPPPQPVAFPEMPWKKKSGPTPPAKPS